jgi:membrane-bound lytic murein transglycosylase D
MPGNLLGTGPKPITRRAANPKTRCVASLVANSMLLSTLAIAGCGVIAVTQEPQALVSSAGVSPSNTTDSPSVDLACESTASAGKLSKPLVAKTFGPENLNPATATPPEREANLINRIRPKFSLPGAVDPAIDRELAWFASHADYIDRVFGRANPYLFHIVEELERREMPLDLALLPIVESAFDPFAYSHGRASGLWQIIPGTGRRLGLKQNWWFDGRRDIPESTRAALDYLALLHEQFDGDWLLAVAGYNAGEGNVARAIRKAESAGRPIDFWSIRRDLPAETRAYVPRLLAIRDLVASPSTHDIELPPIPNEPHFEAVPTESQIDMALAAELAGVDIDTLYALNPGINRWATDPEGPHRLIVPVGQAGRFAAMLSGLAPEERLRWTRHEIQPGETLGQLAERYQTTSAALRETNSISGSMIRAGQHLMIPRASEAMDSYSQSLDARVDRQLNTQRPGNRQAHTVKPGESFWVISQRYGVGVRELAGWNAMAPGDVLSVGRKLVVWSAANVQTTLNSGSQIRRINYLVRRGDSLAAIAGRFRVTIAKLLEWNELNPERYLQPGQRIVMFVDVTEQSS